jgi:hypothetical protein
MAEAEEDCVKARTFQREAESKRAMLVEAERRTEERLEVLHRKVKAVRSEFTR